MVIELSAAREMRGAERRIAFSTNALETHGLSTIAGVDCGALSVEWST